MQAKQEVLPDLMRCFRPRGYVLDVCPMSKKRISLSTAEWAAIVQAAAAVAALILQAVALAATK